VQPLDGDKVPLAFLGQIDQEIRPLPGVHPPITRAAGGVSCDDDAEQLVTRGVEVDAVGVA
jgi:hypothetical protein